MLAIFAKTQNEYRITDAILLANQPLLLTYGRHQNLRVVSTTLAKYSVYLQMGKYLKVFLNLTLWGFWEYFKYLQV
jgi:hypothetical protein